MSHSRKRNVFKPGQLVHTVSPHWLPATVILLVVETTPGVEVYIPEFGKWIPAKSGFAKVISVSSHQVNRPLWLNEKKLVECK